MGSQHRAAGSDNSESAVPMSSPMATPGEDIMEHSFDAAITQSNLQNQRTPAQHCQPPQLSAPQRISQPQDDDDDLEERFYQFDDLLILKPSFECKLKVIVVLCE